MGLLTLKTILCVSIDSFSTISSINQLFKIYRGTLIVREGFYKKSHKLGLFAQPKGGRGPEGVIGSNLLNRYPFFAYYCSKYTER